MGLWAGDGAEGAKFWLQVLTELKNRGVQDVCIAVCDGLKGLPDAINTVWEFTTVQQCIIHLIRNTFRYASRKYWDQISHDMRPVYTAATEAAAKARFAEFTSRRSPTAIESLNARYRVQGPGCQVEALHRCLVVGEVRSSCRSWITTSRSARSCPDRRILMSRSDV